MPAAARPSLVLAGIVTFVAACAPADPTPQPADSEPALTGEAPRVRVVETGPLRIDRLYPSMTGPSEWVDVDVSGIGWVTAYKTEVVEADSREKLGDQFFCHSQLQQLNTTRLMVTATGAEEIRFPPGFGMPVGQLLGALPPAERSLMFLGMVLNNYEQEIDLLTRIRATIEYYPAEPVGRPPRLKKLYKTGLTLEVEDLAAYTPDSDTPVNPDVTTHCSLVNDSVSHWYVPPGPQITRKRYRDFLAVDGTVHYAVVHLHNYGVYFRLTDVTTGEQLWQTDVVYEPERMQIEEIPMYSSATGFRIYKDHEYELEAYYNNTSDADVDAMAQIDLYYRPDGDVELFFPNPPS